MRLHPYRTTDNKIDGAVIVLVDVDQAKRSQEALEEQAALLRRQNALIELSQDAIVVRDGNDCILTWNRGAEVVYGWKAEEAVGRSLYDLVPSGDPPLLDSIRAELERHGEWEGELRQIRRDGVSRAVHSRQVLVRDDSATSAAVLAINRDVTEVRR